MFNCRIRMPVFLFAAVPMLWACPNTNSTTPIPKTVESADAGLEDVPTVPAPDGGLPTYTWWQDVQPIVAEKCQLCHADPPQYTAPRALVSYEDTQKTASTGAPVHAEMAQLIYAASSAMPPPSQPQLTEQEKEIIKIWSLIGAPEGTKPTHTPDGGVTPDAGMQGFPDLGPGREILILATNTGTSAPYTLPVKRTNYVCWSLTIPEGGGDHEHAVRFEHVIDNTTNLHHMLLFKNREGDARSGPFECGSFPLDWDMISGWAPGRRPEVLPDGVGVPMRPGEQVVLQAHYDDVRQADVTDNSGIRIVTVNQEGLTPAGIMWSGGPWYPPLNGSNVRKRGTCRITTPIKIFQNFPHMHEYGLRITLEVRRAGSNTWDLLTEVPAWDFEDQPNISIPMEEQQLNVDDQLRTTCWWDTQGQSVPFGETTSDEMCFNFIYHYPLLSNPTLACVSLLN